MSIQPSLPVYLPDNILRHFYKGISTDVSLLSSLLTSLRGEYLQFSLLTSLRSKFLRLSLLTSLRSEFLHSYNHLYSNLYENIPMTSLQRYLCCHIYTVKPEMFLQSKHSKPEILLQSI